MVRMVNLDGVESESKDFLMFDEAFEIPVILNNDLGATIGASNGSLNVYKDDEGLFRCEAMRHLVSLEKKYFDDMEDAVKWAEEWIPNIR